MAVDPVASKFFQKHQAEEANAKCCDSVGSKAEWASVSHGIYISIEAAGVHRSLGVKRSFVLSTSLDSWKPEHLKMMQLGGVPLGFSNICWRECWGGNITVNLSSKAFLQIDIWIHMVAMPQRCDDARKPAFPRLHVPARTERYALAAKIPHASSRVVSRKSSSRSWRLRTSSTLEARNWPSLAGEALLQSMSIAALLFWLNDNHI